MTSLPRAPVRLRPSQELDGRETLHDLEHLHGVPRVRQPRRRHRLLGSC
jgi:hypothetical protein